MKSAGLGIALSEVDKHLGLTRTLGLWLHEFPGFKLLVFGSRRLERGTSGQATSSGVVEGVCGVGLRAKHLVGLNLQAVLISSSSNNAYRMEACSVDAAEPLR